MSVEGSVGMKMPRAAADSRLGAMELLLVARSIILRYEICVMVLLKQLAPLSSECCAE